MSGSHGSCSSTMSCGKDTVGRRAMLVQRPRHRLAGRRGARDQILPPSRSLLAESAITAKLVIQREGKQPLVATFGGIPFKRKKDAVLADEVVVPIFNPRVELVLRLQADRCEICKSTDGVQVHHIRKLADLKKKSRPLDLFEQVMAGRKRKTLVLCRKCHADAHAGRLDGRNARRSK